MVSFVIGVQKLEFGAKFWRVLMPTDNTWLWLLDKKFWWQLVWVIICHFFHEDEVKGAQEDKTMGHVDIRNFILSYWIKHWSGSFSSSILSHQKIFLNSAKYFMQFFSPCIHWTVGITFQNLPTLLAHLDPIGDILWKRITFSFP